MTKSLLFRFSILSILFMSILLIRLPFLSNLLQGEEGLFAYVVSGDKTVKNTDQSGGPFLIARVNNKNYYAMPAHPILPYLFLEKIIRPIFIKINHSATTFQNKSLRARLPFLFIFALGLLFLMSAVNGLFKKIEWYGATLITSILVFVLSSPLLVGGSIQPQLDGSIGVLLMGISAFLLVNADKDSPLSLCCYTLAGFFSALGKNEWAVALLFSVILIFFISCVSKKYIMPNKIGVIMIAILVGIMMGSWVSYIASPENFLGGFHTAQSISSNKNSNLITVFLQNISWIWQLGIIVLFSTWLLFKNISVIKNLSSILILYFWGMSLGGGFLLIPWLGDGFPRYYIPSYFILLFMLVALIKATPLKRTFALLASFVFILAASINGFSLYIAKHHAVSITSSPGSILKKEKNIYLEDFKKFQTDHKLAITGIAYGYYFHDADFVGESLGPQGISAFLHQHPENKK